MKRTLAENFAELRQGDWLVEVLFQVAADPLHHLRLCVTGGSIRPAAQASAKARALRFFRSAVESNVLAAGTPGGARRTAENTGGRHRKDKFAILACVAGYYCFPPVLVINRHH